MNAARILIVDDDANMLLLMKYHLEGRGYSVVTAEDGLEALHVARGGHFDLFLLDVMLPGLDGFDLCRRLRREATYRDTPIMLVTARGQEGDFQTAESSGATRYITKPFDPIQLTESVAEQLAARSEARE